MGLTDELKQKALAMIEDHVFNNVVNDKLVANELKCHTNCFVVFQR